MRLSLLEGSAETTLKTLLEDSEGRVDAIEVLQVVDAIERYGFQICPHPRQSGDLSALRLVLPRRSVDLQRDLLRMRIKQGEGQRLEFKSTYLRCMETLGDESSIPVPTESLRKAVLKSICAFLNSDGGEVLVGVSNRGDLVGIEPDYPLVAGGKAYEDPREMWSQCLFTDIKRSFHEAASIVPGLVQVEFVELDGKMIAWIRVLRSERIRLMRREPEGGKSSPFVAFVRREFESVPLELTDFETYVLRRVRPGSRA